MAWNRTTYYSTPPVPLRPIIDLSDPSLPCNNIPPNIAASGGMVQPFVNDLAKQRFNEVFHRGVVSERTIRLDETYDKYYLPYFQFQGWNELLNLDEPIYPMLIKYFYANFKAQRNEDNEIVCVVSAVKGVPMRLTVNNVADVLGISGSGTKVFFTSQDGLYDNVSDIDEYYRAFTYHESNPNRALKGTDILPEYRLLRHFISFSLSPKGGHRDDVDTFQGFILNSLVVKRRICLPYIILSAMDHAINQTRTNPNLPYGAIVTKLLRAAGVTFDSDDMFVAMDKPIDRILVVQLKGFPPSSSSQVRREAQPPPTPPKRVRTEEERGEQLDRIEIELGSIRAEMKGFMEEVRKSISSTNKEIGKIRQKLKRIPSTGGDDSDNSSVSS